VLALVENDAMAKRHQQVDRRWSQLVLGDGPRTIGQAGCLLVALCEAARELGVSDIMPPQLNSLGRQKGAFIGSAAISEELGRVAGLDVGKKVVGDESILRGQILAALRDGGRCLLHVDKDANGSGDHWVLAVNFVEPDRIQYADPATGNDAELNARSLNGATIWGTTPKVYRVTGVRTVHRPH
jgi:hypothetical protein